MRKEHLSHVIHSRWSNQRLSFRIQDRKCISLLCNQVTIAACRVHTTNERSNKIIIARLRWR